MVKAICKLLNITPSTYHLWNRKDENLITKVITEHPRYMLIQFIKSIFINPDEIYRYIKYEFLFKYKVAQCQPCHAFEEEKQKAGYAYCF